jgi:hypothetical protein
MTDTKTIDAENPKCSSWCGSTSLCLLAWCSIALFFFLISWAVGGDEFAQSIGGYYTLTALVGGMVVGLALKLIPRLRGAGTPQH